MKNLYVSFILDETGSMESVKSQTISGFNEYITTLGKDPKSKNICFTLTKFNSNKVDVVYDGENIEWVVPLDNKNYIPDALTPLYDAIGITIRSLEKKLKGENQHALVVIQTDGQENASKEYTRDSIFKLIYEKKKLGWTFAFLGADQDAYLASSTIGISAANTISYSGAETVNAFNRVAVGTQCFTASNGTKTDDFFEDSEG